MKLLLLCFCGMLVLVSGQSKLELRTTWEDENMNRLETTDLASDVDDETEEKRFLWWRRPVCQSGSVKSIYCTTPANECFGKNGKSVGVSFPRAFSAKPNVMIGLTLIDTDKNYNVRVKVSAEKITRKGFEVNFSPWDKSITYQLAVNWMACRK